MRGINFYIELHVRETVRLERLTPTADGYVAAPHGARPAVVERGLG